MKPWIITSFRAFQHWKTQKAFFIQPPIIDNSDYLLLKNITSWLRKRRDQSPWSSYSWDCNNQFSDLRRFCIRTTHVSCQLLWLWSCLNHNKEKPSWKAEEGSFHFLKMPRDSGCQQHVLWETRLPHTSFSAKQQTQHGLRLYQSFPWLALPSIIPIRLDHMSLKGLDLPDTS